MGEERQGSAMVALLASLPNARWLISTQGAPVVCPPVCQLPARMSKAACSTADRIHFEGQPLVVVSARKVAGRTRLASQSKCGITAC